MFFCGLRNFLSGGCGPFYITYSHFLFRTFHLYPYLCRVEQILRMNKVLRIYLLMLIALVVCSCNDSRQAEIIRQAEQIMQEQPDSALHLLQSIPRKSLRGETLARYALIYSMAQDKSGLDVTSDSLLRIAYEYYCQHPDDSLYARSQYYMGKYLWFTAQTDSAYNCLLKARTVSEAEGDYYTAYLVTDRMRRIAEVSDTALCLRLSKEAYRLYKKQGADNPVNEAYLLIGIGDTYFRRHEGDSAIHYYNIALSKAKSAHDSIVVSDVYQNMSRYYSLNKQHETALDYAQQALSYRGSYDISLLLLFAQCYTEIGELQKAQQYLNALPPTEEKETKLARLNIMHRISAKSGDADETQTCFVSAIDVAADMYLSTQKEKLELHHRNMQEELERQKAESRGKIFALSLSFSIVLLVLIVWIFLKYYRSKKAEIAHFQVEKAYKERMMEQTRQYVRNIVHFQQKIEEMQGAKRHLVFDSKDWDEIQAYLEACDNSFVTRFKEQFPDISERDFQFCMLLRCGFTNPDLEKLYSRQTQVIKNKQNLLRKKLGLKEEELSLRQYIKSF